MDQLKISIRLGNYDEGCFFDSYGVFEGNKLIASARRVRDLEPEHIKAFLKRLHCKLKMSPEEAAALLGIAWHSTGAS